MAEVWANVVYTPKTNLTAPLGDSKEVPKTQLWEMPSDVPKAPEVKTEIWEMPEIPAPPIDTTTVAGGTRPAEVAQAPQDDSWFDKVLDFLGNMAPPDPEPTVAQPQPFIVQPLPQPIVAQPQPEPVVAQPKPEPKPDPEPIPASGRTFKTQGDPLVRTGDGLWFGVHEPGKYVSLKSAGGDFMMEQEISKTKDGRKYNTGMGFQLGNNKIAIDTNDGNGPGSMTVNGQKYDLKFAAHGITLPDGGKVSYDPKTNQIKIAGADGDEITVKRFKNAAGVEYLNADVTLSEKRPAGSVHGLLGSLDADDDAKNDTRGRDGEAIAVNGTTTLDMNDGRLWKTPEAFAQEWKTQAGEGIL